MGIIERRDGMFYCTRERINADMVMQVLSWNAKQRHIEKGTYHDGLKSNDRTDEFYARLPDFFTTETASIVAKELGIPKTTMQRIFRKDARFHRMMHGKYCKAHVATSYTFTPSPISADDKKVLMTFLNKEEDSAPVPAITEPQKPIENTVTVNLPPRTVSILWGMIRFTL